LRALAKRKKQNNSALGLRHLAQNKNTKNKNNKNNKKIALTVNKNRG
jgi:hypothetical protein